MTLKATRYNWLAGFLIGLMPLLAHGALHLFAKAPVGWVDNWAPDMLFITISNSGLAALSVFVRSGLGEQTFKGFSPFMILVWASLLICFAGASMLYGIDVIGNGNQSAPIAAGLLILVSCLCSYNFEVSMAKS